MRTALSCRLLLTAALLANSPALANAPDAAESDAEEKADSDTDTAERSESISPHLRLRARVYTRYRTGVVERTGGDESISSFDVPESRLALNFRAAYWLSGQIDFDVANQAAALRDGFVDLRYDRSLRLRVGRFKRPFSRVQLTSRRSLPVWRRGLTSNTIVQNYHFGDRDRGAMLHGRLGELRYAVGWFDGGDLLSGDDHAEDGSARLTYKFGKLLQIGASSSLHYVRDPVGIGGGQPRNDRWAAGIDARLRLGGLDLVSEVIWAQGSRTRRGPEHLGVLTMAQFRIDLAEGVSIRPVLKAELLDHHLYRTADAAWSATGGINLHLPMGVRILLQGEGVWTDSNVPDSVREELLGVLLIAWDYRLVIHADGPGEGDND